MDPGPLRAVACELFQSALGVPATVTRPTPDDIPVATSVIWVSAPKDDAQPVGSDLMRRGSRRVMAIPRAELDTLPRSTVILAPEAIGGAVKTWRADGFDRVSPEFYYVIVVPYTTT